MVKRSILKQNLSSHVLSKICEQSNGFYFDRRTSFYDNESDRVTISLKKKQKQVFVVTDIEVAKSRI